MSSNKSPIKYFDYYSITLLGKFGSFMELFLRFKMSEIQRIFTSIFSPWSISRCYRRCFSNNEFCICCFLRFNFTSVFLPLCLDPSGQTRMHRRLISRSILDPKKRKYRLSNQSNESCPNIH